MDAKDDICKGLLFPGHVGPGHFGIDIVVGKEGGVEFNINNPPAIYNQQNGLPHTKDASDFANLFWSLEGLVQTGVLKEPERQARRVGNTFTYYYSSGTLFDLLRVLEKRKIKSRLMFIGADKLDEERREAIKKLLGPWLVKEQPVVIAAQEKSSALNYGVENGEKLNKLESRGQPPVFRSAVEQRSHHKSFGWLVASLFFGVIGVGMVAYAGNLSRDDLDAQLVQDLGIVFAALACSLVALAGGVMWNGGLDLLRRIMPTRLLRVGMVAAAGCCLFFLAF